MRRVPSNVLVMAVFVATMLVLAALTAITPFPWGVEALVLLSGNLIAGALGTRLLQRLGRTDERSAVRVRHLVARKVGDAPDGMTVVRYEPTYVRSYRILMPVITSILLVVAVMFAMASPPFWAWIFLAFMGAMSVSGWGVVFEALIIDGDELTIKAWRRKDQFKASELREAFYEDGCLYLTTVAGDRIEVPAFSGAPHSLVAIPSVAAESREMAERLNEWLQRHA